MLVCKTKFVFRLIILDGYHYAEIEDLAKRNALGVLIYGDYSPSMGTIN